MNQNPFNHVVKKSLHYGKHNLSYHNLLSCDFGAIIPHYLEMDLVPGDRARINSAILAKFAPFISPVYAEINILTEYYFIPYRILQSDYIKTMSGGESGSDFPPRSKIIINSDALNGDYGKYFKPGSLADYLGINFAQPIYDMIAEKSVPAGREFDFVSYPFKAYQFIYNEYYRDQNITNAVEFETSTGDILTYEGHSLPSRLLELRYSAWKKDYFTSAIPFTQRGGQQFIPIDGIGDVYYQYKEGAEPSMYSLASPASSRVSGTLISAVDGMKVFPSSTRYVAGNSSGATTSSTVVPLGTDIGLAAAYNPDGTLKVDFRAAEILVEGLRIATSLQQFMELKARSGGRDREFLYGQFGVDNKDMRLTIPQLIGGGVQNVVMSEILQSSQSTDDSPQGNRTGDANSFGSHGLFRDFYVTEPGMIMGVMRIVPKAQYMNGISRHYKKYDDLDDFNPFFQHLGEQEIKSYEIYHDGTDSDENTFGYAPRYAEYKWHQSEIHGDFKTSLDHWHVARMFEDRPVLNTNFIEVRPDDVNRVFAVQYQHPEPGEIVRPGQTETDINRAWVEIYNKAIYIRPIIKNAIPQLI